MKVIDLLNKIANKEEIPKKIKFENDIYIYNEYDEFYYINGDADNDALFDRVSYFDMTPLMNFLNEEVEIIEDTPKEDKKIEKLDVVLLGQCDNWLQPTIDTNEKIRAELNPYIIDVIKENTLVIQRKINELIDKINGE